MKSRLFGAMCAVLFTLITVSANAAVIPTQGTWTTTLQGRDLDGNAATFEAYYDTTLDITWLADANYAQTSGHDLDGKMTWSESMAWAEQLTYFGLDNWRLPKMVEIGDDGCTSTPSVANGTDCGFNVLTTDNGIVYNELASLYYDTLGNLAPVDSDGNQQLDWGLKNTGPFVNIQQDNYWSSLTYTSPGTSVTYYYSIGFHNGDQDSDPSGEFYAWAVHDGDVSAVPIPPAIWLFGSGLLGLVGIARRK